jgi:HPr kinase/phosphorylase
MTLPQGQSPYPSARILHGSAAAREGAGVLLIGPPGAGKSDLLLRLLNHGFSLVADDQVLLHGLQASPPPALAGLLEVRGLGIFRLPFTEATLILAVRLKPGIRLPEPARLPDLDIPLVNINARAASAPHRVALALDCLLGKVTHIAGAFT